MGQLLDDFHVLPLLSLPFIGAIWALSNSFFNHAYPRTEENSERGSQPQKNILYCDGAQVCFCLMQAQRCAVVQDSSLSSDGVLG